MRNVLSALFAVLFFMFFSISADEKWSTQKTAGAVSVCYQSNSAMYCSGSSNKKTSETDLKHYLSVFLYFSTYEVNKNDLILQPGITRLIKGSRPEQGDRVLKGAYDYLLREAKSKMISLSSGTDKASQKVMQNEEQISEIESVNWPKYIDSLIEATTCTSDQKVSLSFKIINSMKKDFLVNGDEIEMRIVNGRNDIMSVGSVEEKKVTIKAGETKIYSILIPITGDMDPSMRYRIFPFIRNIQVSKDDASVLCEKQ